MNDDGFEPGPMDGWVMTREQMLDEAVRRVFTWPTRTGWSMRRNVEAVAALWHIDEFERHWWTQRIRAEFRRIVEERE